jgi:hypothetical protein
MASIPVTIQGVMTYSGLEVGGGPMPGGPEVSHPIAPGGLPPGIWGGGNEPFPTPPIYIPPDAIAPGVPSHPIVLPPGRPTHPIVIPPGSLAPGVPTHPIYLPPPVPAHPIVIPPGVIDPGPPPVPAHPIVLPPLPPDLGLVEWQTYWSEATGWVVIGVPNVPAPTPSARP